ncbi:hypothetical protein RJZ57_003675 [Blastomyces gilchristii]
MSHNCDELFFVILTMMEVNLKRETVQGGLRLESLCGLIGLGVVEVEEEVRYDDEEVRESYDNYASRHEEEAKKRELSRAMLVSVVVGERDDAEESFSWTGTGKHTHAETAPRSFAKGVRRCGQTLEECGQSCSWELIKRKKERKKERKGKFQSHAGRAWKARNDE